MRPMKIEVIISDVIEELFPCTDNTHIKLTWYIPPEADFKKVITHMLNCLARKYIVNECGKSLLCEIDGQLIPYSCIVELGTVQEVYDYSKTFYEHGEEQ